MNRSCYHISTVFSVLLLLALLGLADSLSAYCPTDDLDTLIFDTFENGLPKGWTTERSSDGGRWQVNEGKIGFYENPGTKSWLYVNDESSNNIGEAIALSPAFDLRDFDGKVEVSFDMLFQEYADSSYLELSLWDGENWHFISRDTVDFAGTVVLDLSEFHGMVVQLQWTYYDEGAWAWGAGLDNFLVTAQQSLCGNGRCDPGETPELCPEDCPYRSNPAPAWIPLGKDLNGNSVTYRAFKGGTPCDDCSEELDLPFALEFYGVSYNQAYLNANGNLTFEYAYKAYTPEPFCLPEPYMIAPYYADLDLTQGGSIDYYFDPAGHYMVIIWSDVAYFGCGTDCDLRNTFQVLITDGSIRQVGDYDVPREATVLFSYGDMQWTTGNSSGGLLGFGGNGATVGMNAGNGIVCHDLGVFDQSGYHYYGSTQEDGCAGSAVSYLDYQTFAVNAATGEIVSEDEPEAETTLSLDLSVSMADESNLLVWELSDSVAVTRFVIEKSLDGEQFTQIEQVPGNSRSFEDMEIASRFTHYRIYLIGEYGETLFSEAVSVERLLEESGRGLNPTILNLWPNPMEDFVNLQLELPSAGALTYQFLDLQGRVVNAGHLDLQSGRQQVKLSVGNLPIGTYILMLSSDQWSEKRTLIKR